MTTIQGLDELQRKLKTLENFQRKLKSPMEEATKIVHRYIGKSTRKKKGAFSAMATPGQRRAYWYLVGKGKIEHSKSSGYKRTGTMQTGWTTEVKVKANGVEGIVGNKKAEKYGKFVQGAYQQPFHKASGYRTIDQTIEATKDKVQAPFRKVVKRELNK